jgi:hypothetical protein
MSCVHWNKGNESSVKLLYLKENPKSLSSPGWLYRLSGRDAAPPEKPVLHGGI